MDKEEDVKESGLLARLESLSKESPSVRHEDFERVLKGFQNITVSEWHKIVKFTSEQLGFWDAAMLFAPAISPNSVAEAEVTGWKMISEVCIKALVDQVPQIQAAVERQQRLISASCVVERRMEYNKTRPFQRCMASVLSRLSISLSKIGFNSIAKELYAISLFPPGTVGRLRN